MPLTIQGIPLVEAGHVNRHAMAQIMRGPQHTYFRLHPRAFQAAVAHEPKRTPSPPEIEPLLRL